MHGDAWQPNGEEANGRRQSCVKLEIGAARGASFPTYRCLVDELLQPVLEGLTPRGSAQRVMQLAILNLKVQSRNSKEITRAKSAHSTTLSHVFTSSLAHEHTF